MDKKLLLIFAITLSLFAFSQNISFETSEGYTLGNLPGQQGWSRWGGVTTSSAKVINTTASIGSNSVTVTSNSSGTSGGVTKSISGFTKTEYSFDYKISAVGSSEYHMVVQDLDDNIVGGFNIEPSQGGLLVYNGVIDDGVATSVNISANTWYNFKLIANLATHTVTYYLNNILLGSQPISNSVMGFNVLNFVYDNEGSGFTMDNIKILNADLLSTSENNYNDKIDVYPNPTSDFINIKIKEVVKSIEIFDLSGKLILKDVSGKKEISISHLQNGSYILKVNTKESAYTKKFIKN
ncbi:Por secretion system C-terminal sorting domain-containing protein [Chryseobacterium piscicola]|uniref:Por secretion system C-terminal sorting domain-containing protein n=4 Tax=Chryseobacterium TaxID=59732 RepID=A0A1N7PE01_9FLAO|nr:MULTISPECIES: T9SS type A sorting domain-containing protein [Chryseobacterium]KNB61898.1 hypothetical protein AC804_07475 [Chryseobacterium sp. Hurlbut01]MCD1119153.1 T9SS type A sorting domain-containing protein [Chryseobacterium turcicum]PQA89966.1 T9SS C-terminal target domain-containing protein [Chryseobacterium piscicola]REC40810.1 T9SS C-terminal target domain-containing protein [Candidatus Chryseobacterium massiliae]REC56296.1 T9SS C-terminal target domain-containing protein [Chryseo